jgi:hypothetical protein
VGSNLGHCTLLLKLLKLVSGDWSSRLSGHINFFPYFYDFQMMFLELLNDIFKNLKIIFKGG